MSARPAFLAGLCPILLCVGASAENAPVGEGVVFQASERQALLLSAEPAATDAESDADLAAAMSMDHAVDRMVRTTAAQRPFVQTRVTLSPSQQVDARGASLVWQRAMQWQRRGSTEYGLGVAVLRPTAGAATPGTAVPVGALALLAVGRPVAGGVSMNLGAGIPIGVQSSAPAWREAADTTAADGRGELRMGLSFSTRSASSDLRRGLALRIELSGSTALTLKPRAGRVGMQLNSQW